MEQHRRAILKALTWRALGTCGTMLIALFATGGEVQVAATIGVVDSVFKIAAYYFHERLWNRIRYGRDKAPEYQI